MARAGLETPSYIVLEKLAQNIEIRKYFSSKWACAATDGTPADYRQSNLNGLMFRKLFNYIKGENTSKDEIKMTAPVLVDYKNPNNKADAKVQMCFYLPKMYHENPPFPIGQNMNIRNEPEFTVAVITYTGFPSVENSQQHKEILVQRLGDAARNFDCVNYSTAGYNRPTDPNSTREVWLKKIE